MDFIGLYYVLQDEVDIELPGESVDREVLPVHTHLREEVELVAVVLQQLQVVLRLLRGACIGQRTSTVHCNQSRNDRRSIGDRSAIDRRPLEHLECCTHRPRGRGAAWTCGRSPRRAPPPPPSRSSGSSALCSRPNSELRERAAPPIKQMLS